jgi:hypothetical protein
MSIPRIISAVAQKDHCLLVGFDNGEYKRYDASSLLDIEMFAPLKDFAFFKNVTVEPGGYAVSWNADIDISEHELWQHGEKAPDQQPFAIRSGSPMRSRTGSTDRRSSSS